VEIGTGLSSLWFTIGYSTPINPSISLKYKVNNNVLRAGVNISRELAFNAGYERILLGKRFQPFAGVDMVYITRIASPQQKFTMVGIGPVVGLEYHISPRFFIQTEASIAYGPGKLTPDFNGNKWEGWFAKHRFLSLHVGYTLFTK
jgi:hypothetical protein